MQNVAQAAAPGGSVQGQRAWSTGEPGTGKELLAATIHEHSRAPRSRFSTALRGLGRTSAGKRAISVMRATLCPETRPPRGAAATGGRRHPPVPRRDLRIPARFAGELMRFLQEHAFERMGGEETLHVDVRLIAASNHNLREEVARGNFREDLFYQLNVVNIELPPLRERPSDILALAMPLLAQVRQRGRQDLGGLLRRGSGEAGDLRVAGERARVGECRRARGGAGQRAAGDGHGSAAQCGSPASGHGGHSHPGSKMEDIERHAILTTLEATRGSTTKAAEVLGMSVRTIQYRLQQYNSAPKSELNVPALLPQASGLILRLDQSGAYPVGCSRTWASRG